MPSSGISVIIPAYNEEHFLPGTLAAVNEARRVFEAATGLRSEIIVVNNSSTDKTSQVAQAHGALVLDHPVRNISSVRNAGIKKAFYELILTVDADCTLPANALTEIWGHMSDRTNVGGALGLRLITDQVSKQIFAAFLIGLTARASGVCGATFFFLKGDALAIGGFPEDMLIAEDRAFAIALKKYGKMQGRKFALLKYVQVETTDRKDLSLKTILPQLGVIFKSVAGGKQSIEEMDYWYKPKR